MSHEPRHRSSDLGHVDPSSSGPSPGKRSVTSNLPSRPQVLVLRLANGDRVADDADAAVGQAAGSSGASLPASLRERFESSLGADLSSVRVHTGAESATAATAVGARAYTTGQDIHFGAGEYDPSSAFGVHLLAHEVAHTVQQQGGPPTRQHKLAVSGPTDGAEVEADRAADAMVAGAAFSVGNASSGLHRKPKDKPKPRRESVPKRRCSETVMIGDDFEIPFREDVDLAYDEGVILAMYERGDGDDRVHLFRGAKEGVTQISQLNADGDVTTTYDITVVAQTFRAVAGGRALSSSGLNVIDSNAGSKVEVRFRSSKKTDKSRITASSQELQASGDPRAFTVSTWRWDGDDVYWTIDCERPGHTVGQFRVFLDGKRIAEESYEIERRVTGAESKELFGRARNKANDLGIHIRGFAEQAGLSYSAAFAKVRDAIASDKEAEAFIRDSAVSVAGVVLSGFLGGALKHAVNGEDWFNGFADGFFSEMTGNGAGAGADIGANLAARYFPDVDDKKVEPLDYFLKVQHGGTAISQALGALLTDMQDRMAKQPGAVEDPLVALEAAIKAHGFPWLAPSTDQFERQAWKTWLAAGNELSSWGRMRLAVISRLDALNVGYVERHHIQEYHYDTSGEQRRKDAEENDQRKKGADARDTSDAAASKKANTEAREQYEETGEFPRIDAE